MTSTIICVKCGGSGVILDNNDPVFIYDNSDNAKSPCEVYQQALEECSTDVIITVHDDVYIPDWEWRTKVMGIFLDNDNRVAVGLGGATSLGRPDLYRKPYNIMNMARGGYASNQEGAEIHGERFTGVRRVAVLDAFFMAVRTDWLRSIGGWPTRHLTHHCLDIWLACAAARSNKEIYMTGVKCNHYGGGSSTKPTYRNAKWLKGGSLETDHQEPHRWLYESYRDVLPIKVNK